MGTKLGGPDSAIRIQIATQPKSRTKADSISLVASIRKGLKNPGWPVQTPAPLPGSILPAKRIVAFYGNPLSKRMGILGEIPYDQMLAKLDTVVGWWNAADPSTPVMPALHLIVSVAQGAAGKGQHVSPALGSGSHREDLRLREAEEARSRFSTSRRARARCRTRFPCCLPFLQRPDVHLGVDPEFNMHYNREGRMPGAKIGAMDAADVNYAIDQLARARDEVPSAAEGARSCTASR